MTLAEASEIFAYWEQNPPAHLLLQAIARLLGWSPRRPAPELAGLAVAPPPGLATANRLGMPDAVLDIIEMRERNRARSPSPALRERVAKDRTRLIPSNEK